MQTFLIFVNTIFQKGPPLIQCISNIAIHETMYVFAMNYCEIRCKYDDYFNTSHVMIDKNWIDYVNYHMIQSVSVLKEMIDVRDCLKECAILNMDNVHHQLYLFKLNPTF